jgi:hypothetical protein
MTNYNFGELVDRDAAGHSLRFIYQKYFNDPWSTARTFTFQMPFLQVKVSDQISLEEHEKLVELGNEIIEQIASLYTIDAHFSEATVSFLSQTDDEDGDCYGDRHMLVLLEQKTIIYLSIYPRLVSMAVRSGTEFPKHLSSIVEFIKTKEVPATEKAAIHIIKRTSYGFESTKKSITKLAEFSMDHYNDDFKPVADQILSTINSDNNRGIVLLHGGMGTGKTSYIKHIMSASQKKVYYVPPDLAGSLSEPGLIDFILNRLQDSVLIIEDAENVLRSREAGGSQAVSNILNISDGILGEVMSSTIICTVNCPLSDLDQALLRPGRLIAEYQFGNLAREKTNNLLEKLYGDNAEWAEDSMTLAEIFNVKNMPVKGKQANKVKLGFT